MPKWEVLYEKYKRSRFIYAKDLSLILFGFAALHLVITIFSVNVPSQLLERSRFPWAIVIFSLFEYVFLVHLTRFVGYVLEVTRSAIGRWTPYLFLFGISSALLFPLTAVSVVPELTIRKVLYLILFNLSIFGYSLSLAGLASDKMNLNNEKAKLLLSISAFLGVFAGLVTSVLGFGSSKDVLVIGAIFLLTSAIAVAFFVVEDKRFKIKLSPTEKLDIYHKYFGKERKALWPDVKLHKEVARFSLVFSFFLIQEFYTPYVWHLNDISRAMAFISITANFLFFILFYYLSKKWEFYQAVRPTQFPIFVSVLMVISYFFFIERAVVPLFLTLALASSLLGLYCQKAGLQFLPTRAERFTFYLSWIESENRVETTKKIAAVFLVTTITSVLLSILSETYMYLLLSILSLSITIIDISKRVI
uniref:MFS transporter n=1 Tax=Fervidobacterium thailandense TaxID=1008305 RepID=A0A7C5VKS3_9BACT